MYVFHVPHNKFSVTRVDDEITTMHVQITLRASTASGIVKSDELLNTLKPGQDDPHFDKRHFQMQFRL